MAVKSTGLSTAGLRSEFFHRYEAVERPYDILCTQYASDKNKEEHRWLGSVATMREWGSGRLAMGLRTESYDVVNQKYESTIEVDRDELDDDQTGQIRMRINGMAQAAANHPTILLEDLLNNGHQAGYLAYDGQIFFSAAHVSGGSGTQDNTVSTAAATNNAPTVAEFQTCMKAALSKMITFKNDRGEPFRLPLNPEALAVVVPANLYLTALEAVGLAYAPSAENPVARNVLQSAGRVLCLPGLTADDAWFLCNVGAWIRPFIYQVRQPLEFQALEYDTEQGFLRDKYLYGVRARYAMAYGLWAAAVRADFTG